jgi:hypothetical protein
MEHFMGFEGGVRRRDHVETTQEKFVPGIVHQLKRKGRVSERGWACLLRL